MELAVSRTNPRIRLHYCDNCGRHHWGEYTGDWRDGDLDFDYKHPDGSPYLCAKGHFLYGGPEYCMGSCWKCRGT